jgi:competence protein ComEC
MGIVFGVREGMPEDLTDTFIKTGVIHITAASGMNVTMLAGAICVIFAAIASRKTALIFAVVAIWFYAGVAGFDASITRASLMATIAFSAGLLGRQNSGWYALLLTGFLMVFISPHF